MQKTVLLILFLSLWIYGFSQEEGIDHHIEYGFSLGTSTYSGDLAPVPSLSFLNPSGGLFYRHHLKDKISVFRINAQVGILSADEAKTDFPLQKNRNLNFSVPFIELSTLYEYKFFDFRDIKEQYFMTPYIFGGLGVSAMLGQKAYLVIPFGIGANFKVSDQFNIGFEVGARKTFTDEIDGYADDEDLNSSHINDWYYFVGLTFSRTVYNQICPER